MMNYKKGFTLVEIIVAGLIISLTALGSFSAYLYARQFSDKFRHRAQAVSGAQKIAEYIRYKLADGYRNEIDLAAGSTYKKIADASSVAVTDPSLSDMLDPDTWQLANLVDNMAIEYTVNDVFFEPDATGKVEEKPVVAGTADSRKFKKVMVKVTYDNRRAT